MPLVVAIVGDALLDVTLDPAEPMRPGGDVPAAVRVGPGGQGANVAVRLARRGTSARLGCALGDDVAGRLVREALVAEGVRVDASSSTATGAVAVLLRPGGERSMLSQRVPLLSGVDLPRLADGADWIVISGYALLEESAPEFANRCAALPVRRAVLGCALPEGRLADWLAAATAARAHLVILNADEARALAPAPRDDVATLAGALAPALGAVVVVTGPWAASAAGDGLLVTVVPATDGAVAVDTTGAGDAFAASVIAGLDDAWPPQVDVLRTAIAGALSTAGEVVRVLGAQGRVAGERGVASR